jgi:hypothetical protein
MSEIKSGFFKMDKLDLLLPKFSVAGSLELTGPLGDLNMSRVSPPLKGAVSCYFFRLKALLCLLVAGSLELTGPLGDLNMSRVSPR